MPSEGLISIEKPIEYIEQQKEDMPAIAMSLKLWHNIVAKTILIQHQQKINY